MKTNVKELEITNITVNGLTFTPEQVAFFIEYYLENNPITDENTGVSNTNFENPVKAGGA